MHKRAMMSELKTILDSFDTIRLSSLGSLLNREDQIGIEELLVREIVQGNLKHCKIDREYVINECKAVTDLAQILTRLDQLSRSPE